MEPCAYSKEVVELGCRLVDELGFKKEVDTSARWMCHHLSELMDRAENTIGQENDNMRRECSDLIMKLWAHRAMLPGNHHPLESFDVIVEAITRLRQEKPFYFRRPDIDEKHKPSTDIEKWLQIAERIDTTARSLVGTCVDKAIAYAAENEKDWIKMGLAIAPESDKYAAIVVKLLRAKEGEEDTDQTDQVNQAAARFQEFGEICTEVADQMRLENKVPHDQR
jgi:hypothetical protein